MRNRYCKRQQKIASHSLLLHNDEIENEFERRMIKELCSSVQTIIAEGGYRGELAENIRNTSGYVLQVIIDGYQKQGFRPIKKRWGIERTSAWFDYNRRLSVIMKLLLMLLKKWSKSLL